MLIDRKESSQKSGAKWQTTSTRRRLLACVGSVTVAGLAGCSGEDTTDSDTEAEPTTERAPNEPDDDGSAESDTDQTETTQEPAETTDDTDGTDFGSETPEPAGPDSPTFEDSVEIEGTMVDSEGRTVELVGRRHTGDLYYEFTTDDGTVSELYVIDETYYSVSEQGCVAFEQNPGGQFAVTDGGLQTDEFESATFWEQKEYTLESVDGTEMRVYEFGQQSSSYTYDYTVYVNTTTGYVHRIDQQVQEENTSSVVYYDNWGNAAPISPPERTCQSF